MCRTQNLREACLTASALKGARALQDLSLLTLGLSSRASMAYTSYPAFCSSITEVSSRSLPCIGTWQIMQPSDWCQAWSHYSKVCFWDFQHLGIVIEMLPYNKAQVVCSSPAQLTRRP